MSVLAGIHQTAADIVSAFGFDPKMVKSLLIDIPCDDVFQVHAVLYLHGEEELLTA